MAITFTSTMAGASADYLRYAWLEVYPITKTSVSMQSTLLDFALVPVDSAFVKLKRGAYINISSATYPNWFTGFVTNEPDLTFIGSNGGTPVWGYTYHCTSDEYLLSLNPLGLVPPFYNCNAGTILTTLVNRIAPGRFDTSNIQPGPVVAEYTIDPTKSLFAVSQDLCNAVSYVFHGVAMKLYFAPQNDPTVPATTIDGNDPNFSPFALTISADTSPIINDVSVLGDIEPQSYVQEYFLGTGLTSAFPLIDSVYGADSSVLITESFGGSTINTTTWNVFDHNGLYLQLLNGYLNSLGGSANGSYDVSLQSVSPLPMEGYMRLTHGEFDFIAGNGIVGSLWTQAPNNTFTGLLYGIVVGGNTYAVTSASWALGVATYTVGAHTISVGERVPITGASPSGYNVALGVVTAVTSTTFSIGLTANPGAWSSGGSVLLYTLNPACEGVGDAAQVMTIDTTKRYCIRTLATFGRMHRTSQPYTYVDATGTVQTVSLTSPGPDTVTWQTYITEIDPTTGFVTNTWVWANTAALNGTTDTYATYCSVISDALECTVTGILISLPIACALAVSQTAPLLNTSFDTWATGGVIYCSGWTAQSASGVSQNSTPLLVAEGSALALTGQPSDIPYVAQFTNGALLPNTAYNVQVLLRKTIGMAAGNVKVVVSGTGVGEVGLAVPVSSISTSAYTAFYGVLTAALPVVPSDLAIKVYLDSGTVAASVYVDDLSVTTAWSYELVGPNEIDAVDGLAPIATIVQPNGGANTSSTYTGAPQYNSGQGVLTFFSDSVTRTTNVPPVGALVRLTYRSAGAAAGRVQNAVSIASEAADWGDLGIRSVVRQDLSPRPRTARECELAASALVAESAFVHYKGQYVIRSEFLTAEPTGGSILKFANLAATMAVVQAEEISQVTTTLDCVSPESFEHTISFGRPNHIQQFLNNTQADLGALYYQVNADATAPTVVDITAIGLNFAPDVTSAVAVTWDDLNVYMDAGVALPSNGICFEVRYTDDSWGADTGGNLVLRTTNRLFSVPRTLRGQVFFIRMVVAGNKLLYSEDQSNGAYTLTSTVVTLPKAVDPDGNIAQISRAVMSVGGHISVPHTPTTSTFVWTFSIRGVPGASLVATIVLGGTTLATKTVVLTGFWQRVSVSTTAASGGTTYTLGLSSSAGATVSTSRWSVEDGRTTESTYTKVNGSAYGPLSRYSAAVHVSFPALILPIVPSPTIQSVTTTATLVAPADGSNLIVAMDTTAGAFTVTLPPSGSYVGQAISCVLVTLGSGDPGGGNDATVAASEGDLYAGASTWDFSKQWSGQEYIGTA